MHSISIIKILLTRDKTAQKMKLSVKDFFSKCDQIRSLLKTSFFLAVYETKF